MHGSSSEGTGLCAVKQERRSSNVTIDEGYAALLDMSTYASMLTTDSALEAVHRRLRTPPLPLDALTHTAVPSSDPLIVFICAKFFPAHNLAA